MTPPRRPEPRQVLGRDRPGQGASFVTQGTVAVDRDGPARPVGIPLEPVEHSGAGRGVEVGEVEHGPRPAPARQLRDGLEEVLAETGQAPIVARRRRPAELAGRRVHRLEEPHPALEEARQAAQVGRLPDQGVEPLDPDQTPAEPPGSSSQRIQSSGPSSSRPANSASILAIRSPAPSRGRPDSPSPRRPDSTRAPPPPSPARYPSACPSRPATRRYSAGSKRVVSVAYCRIQSVCRSIRRGSSSSFVASRR